MQSKFVFKRQMFVFVFVFSFVCSLYSENITRDSASLNKDSIENLKNLKASLKSGVRNVFESMSKNSPKESFGTLPEGFKIIEGNGFRGIRVTQGLYEIRVHTWFGDTGLLEEYKATEDEGYKIIAAINGTFYSERGALGQIISDGEIPKIKMIPGRLSRCFLATFRDSKDVQFWYLGETALHSEEIIRSHANEMIWFNGSADKTVVPDNLIGGGGWILKKRKDVHGEAEDRQFFRFRREDLTSRKTVIAQDTSRNLFFLVFEAGFTMHQVAREFVKNDIFREVQDAIFLDGGSSSCMVLKGKYLVAPLYMVDKSRFSCIQILKTQLLR